MLFLRLLNRDPAKNDNFYLNLLAFDKREQYQASVSARNSSRVTSFANSPLRLSAADPQDLDQPQGDTVADLKALHGIFIWFEQLFISC